MDALLVSAARQRPNSLALADAVNRPAVSGGAPRRLDWRTLDDTVDRLASALAMAGLGPDQVVATSFPMGSDGIIALLALSRLQAIAAPLPLGWGRREIVSHLKRTGARAILTCGRAGPLHGADMMRHAAAEVFSVRAVFSLGEPYLDGVTALDDAMDDADFPRQRPSGRERAEDHVCLVTADATAEGTVAVPRSSAELFAVGLVGVRLGQHNEESVIAAALGLDTMGSIGLQMIPWLVSQGALVAHSPFAPRVFAQSLRTDGATHAILPANAVMALGDEPAPALRHVLLTARSGHETSLATSLRYPGLAIDAVFIAGELGVLPLTGSDGRGAVPSGPAAFSTSASTSPALVEARASSGGELHLRGCMVPTSGFSSGIRGSNEPVLTADPEGWVATGIRVEPASIPGHLAVSGEDAAVIARFGARRFAVAEINNAYAEADTRIRPVLRSDPLLGTRVVGVSGDGRAVTGLAARLEATGLTPLAIPGATRHGGPIPIESPAAETQVPGSLSGEATDAIDMREAFAALVRAAAAR